MKLVLLSSVPSSAIHLMYYVQTQGLKIDDVIVVREDSEEFSVIEEYAQKNNFGTCYISDPNGGECEEALKELEPDALLLMVDTIVEEHILDIPDTVVNTHSGILPYFRGLDSHRWAVLEGGPVGVSAHLVDTGVDTGPIIKTSELSIQPEDTIASIAERNYYTNKWQTLTEALLELKQSEIDAQHQAVEEGKQYFVMHEKLREVVSEILEQGAHPNLP